MRFSLRAVSAGSALSIVLSGRADAEPRLDWGGVTIASLTLVAASQPAVRGSVNPRRDKFRVPLRNRVKDCGLIPWQLHAFGGYGAAMFQRAIIRLFVVAVSLILVGAVSYWVAAPTLPVQPRNPQGAS
jgi:hypothetical protein